jgi:hypothetical protein
VLSLNTEFFLPIRWGYADMVLLAPLALLLPDLLGLKEKQQWLLVVVLFGLLSGPLGQLLISLDVATVLRSWVVMGALTILVLWRAEPRERPVDTPGAGNGLLTELGAPA